jgi:hypothetical protein
MGKLMGLALSMIGIVQLFSSGILFYFLSYFNDFINSPFIAPDPRNLFYTLFYEGCAFAILQLSTGIIVLIAGITEYFKRKLA